MQNKIFSITVSSAFSAEHSHDKTLNEAIHRHDFKYEITLRAPLNEEGYIEDFRKVENLLKEINSKLEGRNLNEILPLPTTENLAYHIFREVKKVFPSTVRITLREKENYSATYEES